MACDGSQHLIAQTTRGGRIGERVASVPRWRYREYGERLALVASGVCPNFLYGDPLLYTLRVSTRYDEPTALFCKYCLWEHIVYNGRNYIMDPLTGWWEQDFEYCYCIYLDRCGCLLRMGIPYFVQGSFELHICDVCSNNGIFDMEERYAGFANIICQAAFRPLRALVVFWRGQSDSKKLHTLGQFLRMKDWLRLRLLKRMAVPGSPSCLHHVVDTIAWLAEKKTCLANALNLFSTWGKYSHPDCGRIWYFNSETEETFFEDDPGLWSVYVTPGDGRRWWWYESGRKRWFYDDEADHWSLRLKHPINECLVKTFPMEAVRSRRLRVRNASNGEELLVPRPFNHVDRGTTIKDVFAAVSRALPWPHEFMQLLIGDKAFDFPHRLDKQEHLDTLLMSLISSSGFERLSDVIPEITVSYLRWIPTDFRAPDAEGYCLCNFGGCCTVCNVPSNQICGGCGNNGCCRTGSCGCDCCCEGYKDFQPQRRCPILGCRPEWAQNGVSHGLASSDEI